MGSTYFDSSALAKLVVKEEGSGAAVAIFNNVDVVVSSRLAYPEVRAAVATARRNRRVGPAAEQRSVAWWRALWGEVEVIELTEPIAAAAADLSGLYSLSGADAVHLASAMTMPDDDPIVVTWDQRLREAAVAAGLAVAPA